MKINLRKKNLKLKNLPRNSVDLSNHQSFKLFLHLAIFFIQCNKNFEFFIIVTFPFPDAGNSSSQLDGEND